MKIQPLWFYLFCLSLYTSNLISQHGITIQRNNPGRFGNQWLPYLKAKWIAQEFGFKYLHHPFAYASSLNISVIEKSTHESGSEQFKRAVILKSTKQIVREYNKNVPPTLYIVNLYTHMVDPQGHKISYPLKFRQILKKALLPQTVKPIAPGEYDTFTVGLHIRTGGTAAHIFNVKKRKYETKSSSDIKSGDRFVLDKNHKKNHPLKFLDAPFYVAQIQKLVRLYPEKKLSVYLFTDDEHPDKIAHDLTRLINNTHVSFIFRDKGNKHDANIIDDLIGLIHCDCLIRSESTFAVLAEFFGNHDVVISPHIHTKASQAHQNTHIRRQQVNEAIAINSIYI